MSEEQEAIELLRKEGWLVLPTPWPDWTTDRFSVRELEWLWANQHDAIRESNVYNPLLPLSRLTEGGDDAD